MHAQWFYYSLILKPSYVNMNDVFYIDKLLFQRMPAILISSIYVHIICAGPKGGQLVDAVRQGLRAGLLAVVPLLIPGGQRVDDRVGRGGGELAA